MYNFAEELSSISFDKIIGGTLNAVVNAQNTSSMTTVKFIKNVGFKTDANGVPVEPIYVDFKYPKEVSPYRDEVPAYYTASVVDGGAAATIKVTYHKKQEAMSAQFKDMVLQVPILTIMPVPFIRVDTTDIELNVKINSISTTEESSSTDTAADVSASANYKAFFVKGGGVEMNKCFNLNGYMLKREQVVTIKHALENLACSKSGESADAEKLLKLLF